MAAKPASPVFERLLQLRLTLLLLVTLVLLLGFMNCLVVNQRVILYLFYVPVVLSSWYLSRREAVGVAILAALLVVAYVFLDPLELTGVEAGPYLWADLSVWGGILVVTAYLIATLRAATAEALRNLRRAYNGVLSILSKFIQTVDADTEAHSVRVSAWAVRIAEAMGLDQATVEECRIAGLLHDVGKVEVSVELLRKAAALSEQEVNALRRHAAHGANLVKPVGGMLANIADAIEAHHEKYDGTGYLGLRGEAIPLVARIICVADAFDARVSDRPYRRGASVFEAMDTLQLAAGGHFDPRVVAKLKQAVDQDGEAILEQPPVASQAAGRGGTS